MRMSVTASRQTYPFLLVLLTAGIGALAAAPFEVQAAGIKDASAFSCTSAPECFQTAVSTVSRHSDDQAPLAQRERVERGLRRLQAVSGRYPGTAWATRARVLAGVLQKEREPARAVELLQIVEAELPLLQDYIRFWRAEALVNDGNPSRAAAVFESIPKRDRRTLLKNEALFRAGDAWYQAGQCPEAIRTLRRAIAGGPEHTGVPAALLKVADCQIREIQTDQGRQTLKQVWMQYPHTEEALEGLARLHARAPDGLWIPTPDERYVRAKAFLDGTRYKEAAREFDKFLAIASEHPNLDEARLHFALALARLKRYGEARKIYQELLDRRGPQAGKAAVWLARIFLRIGEGDRLVALSQLVALPQALSDLRLSNEQEASVYLFLGVWLEDEGDDEQAIATYQRAAQTGAATSVRGKALWRIGWIHYRTGRFIKAVDIFAQAVDGTEANGWTPQLLYWMGRAQEQREGSRAARVYDRLCRDYPLTYYGLVLGNCRQMVGSGEVSPSERESSSPEAGLNGKLGRPRQDLHYRKAMELRVLGLQEDAVRELRWVARSGLRLHRHLLEVSRQLSEVGAVHEALRLMKINFPEHLQGRRPQTSPTFWQVAYPMTYLPVIESYAEDPVDPYLVAAIIREESLYDVHAISPAGAVGLMQIMPATARNLTGKGGTLNTIRERLFEHQTNIRLGSRYLGILLRRFSENLLFAVAAYNAGPVVVSSWIRERGDADPVEFVESIPYRETREYVKRVLRSYREYHRLGNHGCRARSLDKVC